MNFNTQLQRKLFATVILNVFIAFVIIPFIGYSQQSIKPKPGRLAAIAHFPIGSAVGMRWLERDSVMVSLLKSDFNSITAENCMKPALIHPEQNRFNWTDADKLAEFCEKYNFRLHGHTLIWHSQVPEWMEKFQGDSTAFEAVFKDHIQTVISRYKEQTKSWDVVNEAIADNNGKWRKTFWLERLGKDYIARAFRYAREAVPAVKLFYNDYSLESDSLKRKLALKMVDSFRKQGVPIDGIGLQMHIRVDHPSLKEIEETFTKFAQTGLLIHISELDISFNEFKKEPRFKAFTPEMADRQKQRYEDVVSAYNRIIPKNQQYGITIWGFADKYNWIRPFFKQPDWPVVYDDSLQRKPAWYGFSNGLTK